MFKQSVIVNKPLVSETLIRGQEKEFFKGWSVTCEKSTQAKRVLTLLAPLFQQVFPLAKQRMWTCPEFKHFTSEYLSLSGKNISYIGVYHIFKKCLKIYFEQLLYKLKSYTIEPQETLELAKCQHFGYGTEKNPFEAAYLYLATLRNPEAEELHSQVIHDLLADAYHKDMQPFLADAVRKIAALGSSIEEKTSLVLNVSAIFEGNQPDAFTLLRTTDYFTSLNLTTRSWLHLLYSNGTDDTSLWNIIISDLRKSKYGPGYLAVLNILKDSPQSSAQCMQFYLKFDEIYMHRAHSPRYTLREIKKSPLYDYLPMRYKAELELAVDRYNDEAFASKELAKCLNILRDNDPQALPSSADFAQQLLLSKYMDKHEQSSTAQFNKANICMAQGKSNVAINLLYQWAKRFDDNQFPKNPTPGQDWIYIVDREINNIKTNGVFSIPPTAWIDALEQKFESGQINKTARRLIVWLNKKDNVQIDYTKETTLASYYFNRANALQAQGRHNEAFLYFVKAHKKGIEMARPHIKNLVEQFPRLDYIFEKTV